MIFSIVFNILGYLVVGYVVLFQTLGRPGVVNDFYDAFMPAVQRYLANPESLYTLTSLPFRSFPSLVYYFMIFYFLPTSPFHLNMLACAIFILVMNLFCCYCIVKITSLEQFKTVQFHSTVNIVPFLLGAYLLMPGQNAEYVLGQVNVITNAFLLLAVYYALKKNECLSFFFLGCAGLFKTTALLLLPLFLFENIRGNPIKRLVVRLVSFIIPFIPSAAMFLIFKDYIPDFISINLTLTVIFNGTFQSGNTSVSKFISTVFNISSVPVFVVVAIVLYGISYYVLIKYRVNTIERFMLGAFVMMLGMSDFYGIHFLFIFGIAILWFMTKPRRFGLKYRILFIAITTSYFGWVLDPLSVIVAVLFFACFIVDLSRQPKEVQVEKILAT